MSTKTIMDINNFWSKSTGGVRRYHLQKMDYYQNKQKDFHLVFLMNSDFDRTEKVSPNLTIQHVKAFKVPGSFWDYRFIYDKNIIKKYLQRYEPDIIEVGSPYILPAAVRNAVRESGKKVALVGFWHADFPVTYVKRAFGFLNRFLGIGMEKLAWVYARHGFKDYKGIQVSCSEVMERMQRNGFKNLHYVPLGIDCSIFNTKQKDLKLIQELKAGEPQRLTMFFPHRFCSEKGLRLLLKAYPLICKKLRIEPALVFAGTGLDVRLVRKAEKKWKHIKYVGYLKSEHEMARYNASCEIGFALSGYETFGLSILEGMASGQSIIGASTGAAAEHIRNSGGGIVLRNSEKNGLADAVCYLAQNRDVIAYMSEKAKRYAQQFSWENCFEEQMKLYSSIS